MLLVTWYIVITSNTWIPASQNTVLQWLILVQMQIIQVILVQYLMIRSVFVNITSKTLWNIEKAHLWVKMHSTTCICIYLCPLFTAMLFLSACICIQPAHKEVLCLALSLSLWQCWDTKTQSCKRAGVQLRKKKRDWTDCKQQSTVKSYGRRTVVNEGQRQD